MMHKSRAADEGPFRVLSLLPSYGISRLGKILDSDSIPGSKNFKKEEWLPHGKGFMERSITKAWCS